MPKSHRPYPGEYRQRIIDLVRKGRTPEELAREFEPSAQCIRNWVRQADRDAGRRQDGLTTDEQEELRWLRRENVALREEREILKKGRSLVCAGDHVGSSKDSIGLLSAEVELRPPARDRMDAAIRIAQFAVPLMVARCNLLKAEAHRAVQAGGVVSPSLAGVVEAAAPVQVGTLACGSGSFAAKVFLELGLRVAHVQLTRLLASCCAPRVRVDCLVLPERQLVGDD